MTQPCIALAVSVAVLAGCGAGGSATRTRDRAGAAAVESKDYVASPTLGRRTATRLFVVTGLGRFRARCARPGVARIAYTVAANGAGQTVAVRTARREWPSTWLDPGKRLAVTIDGRSAPRADWQIAVLSEGNIDVLTGSFTVSSLSRFGCFVTGRAQAAQRRR